MGSLISNYHFENAASIPAPFNQTIPDFFRVWDDAHLKSDDYLNFFAPDVHFSFGRVAIKGRDGIRKLRASLIQPERGPVVDCEHTLKQCYVLAGESRPDAHEFLLKGSIWYMLKNGRRVDADFITYVKLVEVAQANWQAKLYDVFLDSGEIIDAIREMGVERQ